ncbi:hypothetical protein [Kribbella deserti]|uniref:Uncharacterized protein n=1 Tax=Kribbella deserti TaxID=1926257 RepID=A0ABV6QR02_9ACTN
MADTAEEVSAPPLKLDPFKAVIDAILLADMDASRKQRHTVKRIFDRLVDEHAMTKVSYQVVRSYVAARKPEVRDNVDRSTSSSFSRICPEWRPRSTSGR